MIQARPWDNKLRTIDDKIVAMFPIAYRDEFTNVRIVPMGKFRVDYKPYIGDMANAQYTTITKDVLEMITIMYDHTYRYAMVDNNSHGMTKRELEKYFSSYFPTSVNNFYYVNLTEIKDDRDIDEVYNSGKISSLEIKLKLNPTEQDIFNNGNNISGVLNTLVGLRQEVDYNVIKLELGAGRKKAATLDPEALKILLPLLNIDSDMVEMIRINYTNGRNKKDSIDLKNMQKNLTVDLFEDQDDIILTPELSGDEMILKRRNYEEFLATKVESILEGMVRTMMPELEYEPLGSYKVNLETEE